MSFRLITLFLLCCPTFAAKNCVQVLHKVASDSGTAFRFGDRYGAPSIFQVAHEIGRSDASGAAGRDLKKLYEAFGGWRNLYRKPRMQEVFDKMNAWAKRHDLDIEFISADELLRPAARRNIRGGVEQANGYVSPPLWNYALSRGKFPVVDLHDFGHASSFAVPGFAQAMRDRTRVQRRLLERAPEIGGASDEVRANTYENLSFLESGPSGPRLVAQGNAAYNGLASLRAFFLTGDRGELRSAALGMSGGLIAVEPGWANEFRQFSPENERLYQKYQSAKETLGIGPGSLQKADKIEAIYEEKIAPLKEKYDKEEDFMRAAMDTLAVEIHRDPELRPIFQLESCLELLRSSTAVFDAYLSWDRVKRKEFIRKSRQ